MLRVNTSPRRKNAPRPAWKVEAAFLQWLRGRPCACGGLNPDCEGKIQAAHVPHKASKGMGTKAADRWAIPLSEGCHIRTQHRIGWQSFAKQFLRADPVEMAEAYWRSWKGDKGELAESVAVGRLK